MRNGQSFTTREKYIADKMRRHGGSDEQIASALGRAVETVDTYFRNRSLSKEQRQVLSLRACLFRRRIEKEDVAPAPPATKKPDPMAISDRDYRANLPPRDLTAAFFGDPPPGYSALDRRKCG